jgi:hypothetical protein
MSNPFSKIVPDAEIYIDHAILDDKPEMAILVARIFATWGLIERELGALLLHTLGVGSTAMPAIAIYETLTAQHLQNGALHAAARSVLPDDSYDVFAAVIDLSDGAATPRHRLAHRVWGGCKQRPNMLALIEPRSLWSADYRAVDVYQHLPIDVMDGWNPDWIDPADTIGYTKNEGPISVLTPDEAKSNYRLKDSSRGGHPSSHPGATPMDTFDPTVEVAFS